MWEVAPGIGPKGHEPRNEFCIDPVGFRPRAPADREGFDLRWGQLPCCDFGGVEGGPQTPFLTTSGLKTNQCGDWLCKIDKPRMSHSRVWQSQSLSIR